jgi:membrane-associated phospholipid phosphatase
MQLEIIKAIQSISNPFFDVFFQGITLFGEEGVAILVGASLLWCIQTRKGYEYAYMLLTGLLVNVTLKEIFDISQPIGLDGVRSLRVETATGKSFPSGHTQTAACCSSGCEIRFKSRFLQGLAWLRSWAWRFLVCILGCIGRWMFWRQ